MTQSGGSLRDALEEAQEKIRQLKALLIPAQTLPSDFALTRRETEVVMYLLSRSPGFVSTQQILRAVYFDDEGGGPSTDILHVFISRARKKLRQHGVFIETRRDVGYALPAESAVALRQILGRGA